MSKSSTKNTVQVTISPPNTKYAQFKIRGTSPLVMNKFSAKAKFEMKNTQEAGQTAKKGKKREPKNFKLAYEDAKHISTKGWCGIPASAFRCALISACKLANFAMTRAKLSLFILPDGFDKDESTPLVKITKGQPECLELPVRLASGVCDIHPRPMWREGWEAIVKIAYDADEFTIGDVTNLLTRVGERCGILEGRPDSRKSAGMGWGLFEIVFAK